MLKSLELLLKKLQEARDELEKTRRSKSRRKTVKPGATGSIRRQVVPSRVSPRRIVPKRVVARRINPRRIVPVRRGVSFSKNGQWALEPLEKYGDAVTMDGSSQFERSELTPVVSGGGSGSGNSDPKDKPKKISGGPLYHIHVDGHRITSKPLSIEDIDRAHGGIKRLESSPGVRLIPLKDHLNKDTRGGDDQCQRVDKQRNDYGANDQWLPVDKSEHNGKELEQGKRVEKEHTDTLRQLINKLNPKLDRKTFDKLLNATIENIAKDHLDELWNYYTKLKTIEKH